MRRFRLLLLLLAVLFLTAAIAAAAYAEEENYHSLVTAQGKTFAVNGGVIFVYDRDAGGFCATEKNVPFNAILADSRDGLFLFSPGEELLIRLETEAPYSETGRWELPGFPPEEYDEIYRAAVADDVLYLLTFNGNSDSFRGIIARDLKNGRLSECPVPSVSDMTCSGEGGMVICSTPLGGGSSLYTWQADSEEQKICPLPDMPYGVTGGLAFHAASGKAFLRVGNVIYALEGNEITEAAFAAEESETAESTAMTEDQVYLQCFGDGTLAKQKITGEKQQVLRIAGYLNDKSLISVYREENPDVAVIYTGDDPYNESAFAEKVLTGNLEADLVVISTYSSLMRSLIQKQYALPVDACAPAVELIGRMYPQMRDQVMREGRYCGLPVGIRAETMGYRPDLFEELGLEVPHSVEELLRFAQNASLPDDTVMWADPLCSFGEGLLQEAIDAAFARGTESDMDAAGKVLEMWEKYDGYAGEESDNPFENALFTRHCDAVPGRGNMLAENARFLLLSAAEGQEPALPADMEVILVYAGTDKEELCLDFLSFCAEHLEDSTRIALLPDENEPVMENGAEEKIQELRELTETIAGMLAEEAENETLQQKQEELLAELADEEKNQWKISAEEIEAYRAVAPCLVFNDSRWRYDTKDHQCYELREQLRTHSISAEEFVRRYSNLMWMLIQEEGE